MNIESSSNPKFKNWRSLLTSKGLKASDQALISGRQVVDEWIAPKKQGPLWVIQTASHQRIADENHTFILAANLFRELDLFGTDYPLLIVSQPEVLNYEATTQSKNSCVILPVGNPKNLGAIIRSSVGFEIDEIVLLPTSAHPFLPEVTRAASATNFNIPIFSANVDQLAQISPLYAMDLNGMSLIEAKPEKNMKLLVGEEGQGLRNFPNLEPQRLTIDLAPQCESLNVAVATGIALFHWQSQTY